MSSVSLKGIKKIYPNKYVAVQDFNLEIEDKEFIIFVGPSGCGKSTTLRMIAGLEDITEGELLIDGKRMNEIEPKDRDIAMVFQNYALYPHMNVYDNMAFGLKLHHVPKDEIDKKIQETAKILHLEKNLKSKPKNLSGGQRQRVAMGRAIVRQPKVFLMDEPLSNLDAKLRVEMRVEIAKLHRDLGATIIYVTHDQTEALTLGTRIVVMKDGIIQQVDTPQHLYDCPQNQFVAGFIGSPQMNFLPAECIEDQGKIYLICDQARILLNEQKAAALRSGGYIGKKVTLGIRPEDISLKKEDLEAAPEAVLEHNVKAFEPLGSEVYLYMDICGANVVIRAQPRTKAEPDMDVRLIFNAERIHVFDAETEVTITN